MFNKKELVEIKRVLELYIDYLHNALIKLDKTSEIYKKKKLSLREKQRLFIKINRQILELDGICQSEY